MGGSTQPNQLSCFLLVEKSPMQGGPDDGSLFHLLIWWDGPDGNWPNTAFCLRGLGLNTLGLHMLLISYNSLQNTSCFKKWRLNPRLDLLFNWSLIVRVLVHEFHIVQLLMRNGRKVVNPMWEPLKSKLRPENLDGMTRHVYFGHIFNYLYIFTYIFLKQNIFIHKIHTIYVYIYTCISQAVNHPTL